MKLKKILVSILAVAMVLSTMGTVAFAQETEVDVWDGESYNLDWLNTGNPEETTGETFYLNSAEDLAGLAYYVNTYASTYNIFTGDTVYLNVDVDLNSHEWSPIGSMVTDKNHFYGSFNGQNHTISNLKISKEAGQIYGGLFGRFKGSNFNQTFSNLTICGVDIATVASTDGKEGAGALMGYGYGQIIDNVHVTGNVNISGNINVGGLAGHSRSKISNSTVDATGSITGVSVTGGLVGYFVHATGNDITAAINDCAVKGVAIKSTDENAGGLVGFVSGTNADQIVIDDVSVSDVTITATNSESGNSVASVAQNFNATNITVANVITSVAGEKTTPSDLVAQIGGTYYTDFEVAIADAALLATEDAPVTVQLMAGTFEAGEIRLPMKASNIIIKGAANKGTILKNSSIQNATFPGAWSEPKFESEYHNVTIDGIVFDNSYIQTTGWANNALNQSVSYKDWTITNCEFKNVETEAAVYFNLSDKTPMENITFTNNIIDGVLGTDKSGFGINAVKGNVTVTGNTITNVDFNALQIQNAPDTAVVNIKNNVLSSKKQLINIYYVMGETSINKNAFIAPEEDVYYVTHVSAKVDLSENFFGIGTSKDDAVFNENYEDLIHLRNDAGVAEGDAYIVSHYTDAFYTELEIIAEAKIGDDYFETLAEAVAKLDDGDTLEIASGTYDAIEVLADDITITGMDENTVITVGSTTSTAFIGVGGDDVTIEGIRFEVPEQVGGSQMWITSVIGYAYSQWAYGGVEPDGWDVVDCEFVQAGDAIANGVFNCRNFSVTGNHFENFTTGIVSMEDGHALGTVEVSGNTFTRVDYPVNFYWGQAGDADDSGVLTITGNTFESAKDEETVSLRIDDYATRNVDESTIAELTITGNTYTAETEVVLTDSAADTNIAADETTNIILNYTSTAIADENLTEGDSFYINYDSATETKAEKTEDGIVYTQFANEEGTGHVAFVNDHYYTSLSEALAAADALENGVVWLLPGEFTVGDVQFPASLTDVTIRGAANKSTVLKDSSFRSADGNAVTYTGITIDGVVFDNSNLIFTGQRNGEVVYSDWTIKNCAFRNIERDANYAAVHFNTAADEAMTGFTFTNNEINGVTGSSNSGLNMMSLAGTVIISGNTIQNVAWNAMQLKNADASAVLTVSDNVISGIGAEEGIFNLSGFAGSKTFSGNTVTKSSDAQAVFCYANGGITLGEGNTWLDAEGNEITDIGFAAAVGDVYYVTREEAFAAAAAGGTITFLTDVEITAPTTWTNNVDLGGHTLTITADGSLTGAVTVSNGSIAVEARTGDAAIGGISLLDVDVLAMEGGNVFAIAPEEDATWENVTADVTGAETGLSIAAGGQLTICGESMVMITDSTVCNLTVQGALTIVDPAVLIAPGAVLSEDADISGEVMEGYTEAAVITPEGGTFKGSVEITITCPTEGAAIYYTTNGETPTTASTLYTEPFILSEIGEWSVCAIAVGESMLPSEEVSAAFVIEKKPRYKSTSATEVQPPAEDEEPGDTADTENKENTENTDDTDAGRRELPFIDVPEDYWGYDEIADCYFEGIMTGMTETTFEPETSLTRGMLVTMLYRLAGSPQVEAEGTEWYAAARAWAMETGVSDGTNMDGAITREQLVTMQYRYAKMQHTGNGESLALFTDAGEISDWALEAMDWAVKTGLVTGMGDGTVSPRTSATRTQVAAIFARYMNLLGA